MLKSVAEREADSRYTRVVHKRDIPLEEEEHRTTQGDQLGIHPQASQVDTLQEQPVGTLAVVVGTEVDTFYFLETCVVVIVVVIVVAVVPLLELGNAGVSLFQPFLSPSYIGYSG